MSELIVRSSGVESTSRDAAVLHQLWNHADKATLPDPIMSRMTFATESISEGNVQRHRTSISGLQAVLAASLEAMGRKSGVSETLVQETAAVTAGLCAGAMNEFRDRPMDLSTARRVGQVYEIKADGVPGYSGKRVNVAEAFDNRESRSAVLYTMAYNYAMARQDAAGELIWPTLTLPADQVGFGIVVNRLTIFRGATHTSDGKPVDFKKFDLMGAEADPTVLRRDRTRMYPVARSSNANYLVPAADVAPYNYDNEGEIISTAPYRTGVEIGWLGLCQSDASLAVGNRTERETIDPAVSVSNLYVKFGDDVLNFNVYSYPGANFVAAPQGIDKLRILNFRTDGLRITKDRKQNDNGALDSLELIATGGYTAVFGLQASGSCNPEFGSGEVLHGYVRLVKLLDADGETVADTNADYIAIAALINAGKIIGYDLRAYRTNLSMRERGDLIDRTAFTQLYEVPLLSPISAQRPQNTDGALDAGDFESLVTATRYRLKNDNVTAILEAVARLDDIQVNGVGGDDLPGVLGAARYHVRPQFISQNLVVSATVNSLKSAEALADLRAAIVNVLRDVSFKLHIQSEYQAAATALGLPEFPTVTIMTDPYIAKYIQIDGELRTLTQNFDLKIASVLDERMRGKIFLTFGVFDETRNQAPCLLNWGNLVWAPEVVLHASVPRGGEHMARETIVQPRYLFVNHMPVCAMLQVSGISDVFNKIPLTLHTTETNPLYVKDVTVVTP